MCQKRQRRCPEALAIREKALVEWTRAETFSDVCRAWGRCGGLITLHRYSRDHYRKIARKRWEEVFTRS